MGKFIHGMANTPEHLVWQGMRKRCNDPAEPNYHGKGVTVCERWLVFQNFYADIGPRPSPDHSIDRYPDTRGNYEPGNVRWATIKEQANNKSTNHIVFYLGQPMTVAQALDAAGNVVTYGRALSRIRSGWDATKAVETPPRIIRKGNYEITSDGKKKYFRNRRKIKFHRPGSAEAVLGPS